MKNPPHMSSDDTRARILNAAGPVFAEKGFQAATVRDICQDAGVNLASVNYYFGDKERLYIETVKRAHQLRADQVELPDWPPGTAPESKLHDFVLTLITRMIGVHAAPWQLQLIMRETLHPTQACRELVQEAFRPHFEVLLGILDELVPVHTPAHARHQIAFSVVGQCLHYHVAGEVVALLVSEDELQSHYSPVKLAEHISSLCLAALGRRQPIVEATPPAASQRNPRRRSAVTESEV